MTEHEKAQRSEAQWWGDCTRTWAEEDKQIAYAEHLDIPVLEINGQYPVYDAQGASVLDLGGGPVSMLLKTINCGGQRPTTTEPPVVVDPCKYPDWVEDRYTQAEIIYVHLPAEEFWMNAVWDECWIYNVLQHVIDPAKVIATAQRHALRIRIFEWIEIPVHQGHPHTLHASYLDHWLGGTGRVVEVNEHHAVGQAYCGVFEGL